MSENSETLITDDEQISLGGKIKSILNRDFNKLVAGSGLMSSNENNVHFLYVHRDNNCCIYRITVKNFKEVLNDWDKQYNLYAHLEKQVFKQENAIWSTETKDKVIDEGKIGNAYLKIQTDMHLVLYDRNHKVIWSSQTTSRLGYPFCKLQDDGNLVVDIEGNEVFNGRWSSGTFESIP